MEANLRKCLIEMGQSFDEKSNVKYLKVKCPCHHLIIIVSDLQSIQ